MISLGLNILNHSGKTLLNILPNASCIMKLESGCCEWALLPVPGKHLTLFPLIISDGSFPGCGQCSHTSALQYSAKELKGDFLWFSGFLSSGSSLLSDILLHTLAFLVSLDSQLCLLNSERSSGSPSCTQAWKLFPVVRWVTVGFSSLVSSLSGITVLQSSFCVLKPCFIYLSDFVFGCFRQGTASSWLKVEVFKNKFSKHLIFGEE